MDKTSKKVASNKWRIVTNISFGVILLVLFVLTTCKMECINQQLKNNNELIQKNTRVLSQVTNENVRADCYVELRHCISDEEDEERGVKYDFFTTEEGTLNINPSDNVYEATKQKILLYTSEDVSSEIEFHFTNDLLGCYTNYQCVAISPNGKEQIVEPFEPEWYTGPGGDGAVWQFKLCERGTYIIDMRNLDDTRQHKCFSFIW